MPLFSRVVVLAWKAGGGVRKACLCMYMYVCFSLSSLLLLEKRPHLVGAVVTAPCGGGGGLEMRFEDTCALAKDAHNRHPLHGLV